MTGDASWLEVDAPGSGGSSVSLEHRVVAAGLGDRPVASLSEGFRRVAAPIEARHGPLTYASLARLFDRKRVSMTGPASNLHSMLYRAACRRLELWPESVLVLGREVLLCLGGRERQVALLRFRDGLTFVQIGRRLDVSSSRSLQIVNKAMRQARLTWGARADALMEPAVKICRNALREPPPARIGDELVAAQLVCWPAGRSPILRAVAAHRRAGRHQAGSDS